MPGRIEVLGKHTDYGGGRSLLCAVERGFHVVASPREDAIIQIVDASTNASTSISLEADANPHPGHWTDYPISVARRVARDFPAARTGMNVTLRSSLPSASGLSSSSALVIATFLPLAAFNALQDLPEWSAIPNEDALAEYLGAVENGRGYGPFPPDRGVGTQGGSEDQTAILRASAGELLQYHFVPVTPEARVTLPARWGFVIAMSGVHAAKGGAVQARYNALANEVATLLDVWNRRTGRKDGSLFMALTSAPDAVDRFKSMLAADNALPPSLATRLSQFADESVVIVPKVVDALQHGAMEELHELVWRSQLGAEQALHNQIPETMHLVRRATEMGAAAASAFGAGFGGSVWALVRDADARSFMDQWRGDYVQRFPSRKQRAEFFQSGAGPGAREV